MRVVRYIDARLALSKPQPVTPQQDQSWDLEICFYLVLLGITITAALLAWVWA